MPQPPPSDAAVANDDPPDTTAAETTLRVLSWNTWLLRPRLWPRGPRVPLTRGRFAPDVDRRAPLVGAALRDRFDVCALTEVFEPGEQASVAQAARSTLVRGPARAFPRNTGSGLVTLVDERRARIVASHAHRYRSGGDLRDADALATKGALHVRVEVDPDAPQVDIVSTHLFAGGSLLPVRGAADTSRHHGVRRRQLAELVEFVAAHRAPGAALLLLGDLNVPAHDPAPHLSHPRERYEELSEALSPLGLVDVWHHHGVGLGHTATFDAPSDLELDPQEPDRVVDRAHDTASDPFDAAGERIDYVWFAPPASGRPVTIERPRRWAFAGRDATGGPAGSLSDHLALSVTLAL